MKSLTNSAVRAKAKKEMITAFKACKFIDALTLNEQEVNKGSFIFYYNKARDGQVGNYVIYEIISTDITHRSDDRVLAREAFLQVDVFSLKSFESKLMLQTILKLEEKLSEFGFSVELGAEDFEPDTKLYHQIMYVSKLYFGGRDVRKY